MESPINEGISRKGFKMKPKGGDIEVDGFITNSTQTI